MCNIFPDPKTLKEFARKHGFSGVDWSFELESLPKTPVEASKWCDHLSILAPLEVRFHCPFSQVDLGENDPSQAGAAEALFRRIIHLVSRAEGKVLTVHIGLGRDSTEPLSWDSTLHNLARLVQYGARRSVKVCLENLAWGWTSKPNLFEKLVRRSGAWVTFDLGHAAACESVRTQQYALEDFLTPHKDLVLNAHIYHREIPGLGHRAPERLEDIRKPLDLLMEVGCPWWVIEMKKVGDLLRTKDIIEEYFTRRNGENA
jgi:sugar phosphate isomerase/epimerase